ncbi:NADH dehydrogenase FAD-containing subunit [Helicobacter sp. 16-1353]|uniref:NAD(P)/FAD-dependent oxidoreductase n=1 Tax=Helicobacter sp. 16-1353 TaxID=2004996 RepID=UPI000DCBCEA9|nr:NAD(P)/FAD-dependent oxidoreductase [Helicobacter sp. 16-1353]RAX51486.1 NADH dehydrogenase FAD-containing subunit [Helicobacter sp. 16-1353]
MQSIPKILILGGGYGGFKVATYLQKHLPYSKANITLISKHDYHYQTTLLHKVAAGTYSARKARIFFRKILDSKKIFFIKDTIIKIDPENQRVFGKNNCYSYDYLVIALGFSQNTYDIKGVDKFCYSLSSLNSAIRLRNNIETRFKDFDGDPLDLHFVVCGSGFTGIEFAAELATQVNELCAICGIDKSLVKIICISRGEHILPMFKTKDANKARRKLDKLSIEFVKGDVIECKKDSILVQLPTEIKEIKANNIIWCAGVKGSKVIEDSTCFESKNSRILVDEFLAVPKYKNVFVAGDCGISQKRNILNAPTAQLANQMGEYIAKNLIKILSNQSLDEPFVFKHRGTVCSIGHTDGVGVVFKISISGELAAFLKNFIENKWIFDIGGIWNVFKKGQFRFRSSN